MDGDFVWSQSARLGSIAKIWVKPMLALARRNISINTSDATKLTGRVNKTFDWHEPPLIERTYTDIELLQVMKPCRVKAPVHLE